VVGKRRGKGRGFEHEAEKSMKGGEKREPDLG